MIFSKTFNQSFEDLKKSMGSYVYDDLFDENGENIIENVMKKQKERLNGKKKSNILVILDDFINDDVFNKKRSILTKLLSMGRHFDISIIIISQSWNLIPSSLRRMSGYDIIYKILNDDEKK